MSVSVRSSILIPAIRHRNASESSSLRKGTLFAVFQEKTRELSTQLPAVSQSSFYRHFACRRLSILTSLPARILMNFSWIAMMPLLICSSKIRVAVHQIYRYIHSDSQITPLIRAMNQARSVEAYKENGGGGVCSGSSLYFNHLFLNSNQSEKAIREIAYRFALGAPDEALVLHEPAMLAEELYRDNNPHLLTLIPEPNERGLTKRGITYQNQDELLLLENGPHIIRINLGRSKGDYHALSLIKISDKMMYIFDPAQGLFKFEGDDVSGKINHFFQQGIYREIYRYHIACYERKKNNVLYFFTPADFLNFRIMILPCFNSSVQFISPDPKRGVNAWVSNPRTLGGYFHYLIFEELVDTVKSWM